MKGRPMTLMLVQDYYYIEIKLNLALISKFITIEQTIYTYKTRITNICLVRN